MVKQNTVASATSILVESLSISSASASLAHNTRTTSSELRWAVVGPKVKIAAGGTVIAHTAERPTGKRKGAVQSTHVNVFGDCPMQTRFLSTVDYSASTTRSGGSTTRREAQQTLSSAPEQRVQQQQQHRSSVSRDIPADDDSLASMYCFEVSLTKCPPPQDPTEERLIVGLCLCDLPAKLRPTRKRDPSEAQLREEAEMQKKDEEEIERMLSFRRQRSNLVDVKPGSFLSSKGPMIGDDDDVAQEEASFLEEFASMKINHPETSASAMARVFSGPQHLAATNAYLGGELGIGWWAHTPYIRGLGIQAESADVLKEGDLVAFVIDGLNDQLHMFHNRSHSISVPLKCSDSSNMYLPCITLVAGCVVTSEYCCVPQLQYVDTYIRGRAAAERQFRLSYSHGSTAEDFLEKTRVLGRKHSMLSLAVVAAQQRQRAADEGGSSDSDDDIPTVIRY